MSDVVKHRFVSSKLDGGDTQQVQPSHWNDGHRFIGGAAGDVLTRDPTDATFGAIWTTPLVMPLTRLQFGPAARANLPAGQNDNFRPPNGDNAVIWLLTPSGAASISSILAEPNNTQHLILNMSGHPLTLLNQSAAGAPGNGILCGGLTNYTFPSYGGIWLFYSQGDGTWLTIKGW